MSGIDTRRWITVRGTGSTRTATILQEESRVERQMQDTAIQQCDKIPAISQVG